MSESQLTLTHQSVGASGFHVITVTLGDKEVHRDGLFLDRSDERQRFIQKLAETVPAIADGAEVSPADVETELIAMAGKVASLKVAAGTNDEAKPEVFPVDLLPPVVRHYVVEGAEARAADPSIVALPVLVTLAACIGTTRKIAPKRDWTAPAILWGAVVARSGSVKSVGYDLSLELLKASEDAEHRAHDEAMREFRIAKLEHGKALQQWNRAKDAGDPPEPPEPPTANRLVVDDQTVEGIAPLLAENPRGLYLLSDELRGFFDGMGAYSAGGRGGRDEARWLTLFDGRPFNVDRKTNRERIYIPMTGVSVAGTIQPGTLGGVVCDGQVESGLLARLLLVMPEPRAKQWTDAEMAETTRLAMQRVIDRLKELDHQIVEGFPQAIVLPLTEDAKQRFVLFVNSHGAETIEHGDALAAAWSKLEGYALRFALVHHLARWASGDVNCDAAGPVGIESIEAGIELSRWFASEAERVYARIGVAPSSRDDGSERHIERLAEWLESRGGAATEREIRRGPRRYRGGEHIETDCRALISSQRATWDVDRKTRRIVLVERSDTGDGDSSRGTVEKTGEASPSEPTTVATPVATIKDLPGDRFEEILGKTAEVSPSPVSPPAGSGERVKVTL